MSMPSRRMEENNNLTTYPYKDVEAGVGEACRQGKFHVQKNSARLNEGGPCLCRHFAHVQPYTHAQNSTDAKTGLAKLSEVRLDGDYFSHNGKRFVPVGAHWVPAKAAMPWPVEWDPKDIEVDFAKMHELGYSMVRLDMMWAWFEPRPGDYNPVAFQQLDYLVSLAHKYQIYRHPSLFIGGEVGEAYWDVTRRHGRHPHSDSEMLRLESNLAAEFGRRYAYESGIVARDLTDEPPFLDRGESDYGRER